MYVGNLDVQLSEETVWELFIQAGPLGASFCCIAQSTLGHLAEKA